MNKVIYKIGDMVEFIFLDVECGNVPMTGEVVVVDAQGTFFNPYEPCYDVRLGNGRWIKHIPQSSIEKKI